MSELSQISAYPVWYMIDHTKVSESPSESGEIGIVSDLKALIWH